jgi:MYXO-CTERM domain-containing protein
MIGLVTVLLLASSSANAQDTLILGFNDALNPFVDTSSSAHAVQLITFTDGPIVGGGVTWSDVDPSPAGGGYAVFDGGSALELPASEEFSYTADEDFAIRYWFRSSGVNRGVAYGKYRTRMHSLRFGVGTSNNLDVDHDDPDSGGRGLWAYWNGGGTPQLWTDAGTLGIHTDGEWHQLWLTRVSGVLSMYIREVNGEYELVDSETAAVAMGNVLGANYIGSADQRLGFVGHIDQVEFDHATVEPDDEPLDGCYPDLDAPEFTSLMMSRMFECGDDLTAPALDAEDSCDGVVAGVPAEDIGNNNVVWSWTAMDLAGNVGSAEVTHGVEDSQVPSLSDTPDSVDLECGDNLPSIPEVTATDVCDGTLDVVYLSSEDNGVVSRFWSAADAAGQTIGHEQLITFSDTLPPVLSGVGDSATVECTGVAPVAPAVTAVDTCDGALIPDFTESVIEGVWSWMWNVEDASGLQASATQAITVEDTISPSIDCAVAISFDCTGALTTVDPSAINVAAVDTCDGSLTVQSTSIGDFPPGDTVVTHTATDAAGLAASCETTVSIVDGDADSDLVLDCVDVEECDGVDNNGDGDADEGFGVGALCLVGVGACETSGFIVCTEDGQGSECEGTAGAPEQEECDGVDGDCDGAVDTSVDADGAVWSACDDTDDDGLTDVEEVFEYGTDPTSKDSDGGGVDDADELNDGTNPNDRLDDEVELDTEADTDADSDAALDTGELDLVQRDCGCSASSQRTGWAVLPMMFLVLGLRRRR